MTESCNAYLTTRSWAMADRVSPGSVVEGGVLVVGSGGIVYNFQRLEGDEPSAPPPWAAGFEGWIGERVRVGENAALMNWRKAPGAAESVSTSGHLHPLFVALGASEGPADRLYGGWQLGSLSLASYAFS